MNHCGECKQYATNPIRGPHCSRTGKAVSFLMKKECFESKTEQDTPDVVTKVCNRCHRVLPITAFSRKSSTKDGYQFQCKECQQEMARQLYEKRKAEQAKVRETEPETIPETKVCRQCGRTLPVTMFGKAPKNHNGLKSYCHDCENENCRKYRAKKRAARPKKDKSKPIDTPVINTLLEETAIPAKELTFERAIRELIAHGSITIKITISDKNEK